MGGSAVAANIAARKLSANDTIRVAVLGVNGRGKDHIKGFQSQPGVGGGHALRPRTAA